MIYFDNNATTRPADEVVEAMLPYLTDNYGNPSSAYSFSRLAREAVREARNEVAGLVGASDPSEIVFTSGGTESDNWAIRGAIGARAEKDHIVTTAVEHEAVRNLCSRLAEEGFRVTVLGVDRDGMIDLEELRSAVNDRTAIVSMMLANNETGVIFPVVEAAQIVKERSDALFHTDAVNAAGKIALPGDCPQIDLISISAHKFHGPKGVGALFIKSGCGIAVQSIGGGQEMGLRAGTEAVHQIAGMGRAAALVSDVGPMKAVGALRDRLEAEVLGAVPGAVINGSASERIPNTSNISFPGSNGEGILARLNDEGICVSTGSACNEGSRSVSPVLKAMDVPFKTATGSVRFSLGRFNEASEVETLMKVLPKVIEELRAVSGAA